MSFAFGIGIGTQNNQGEWLEVYYQQPIMTPGKDLIDVVETALDYKGGNQAIEANSAQLAQFATPCGSWDRQTRPNWPRKRRRAIVLWW